MALDTGGANRPHAITLADVNIILLSSAPLMLQVVRKQGLEQLTFVFFFRHESQAAPMIFLLGLSGDISLRLSCWAPPWMEGGYSDCSF
jgi:hypothetical protein